MRVRSNSILLDMKEETKCRWRMPDHVNDRSFQANVTDCGDHTTHTTKRKTAKYHPGISEAEQPLN